MRYSLSGIILCAFFTLSGCVKDTLETTYTYTMARPVYKTSEEVRSAIKNQPAAPVSAPGKMYIQGNYIFLNEINKGIHIINNADPANPVNEAFITIPGCEDMAVLGNTLYADCYTDLMVIDISNPKSVALKHYIPNLFPHRQYIMGYFVDSNKVIADWVVKDTTVTTKVDASTTRWISGVFWFSSRAEFTSFSQSNSGAAKADGGAGKGGSMARFAISHAHMYAVTTNKLITLGLEAPQKPVYKTSNDLPWGIETIYPFKDKLFIGANSGMHIFTLDNPAAPKQAGTFTHARVCDPVIADDNYAYVTLRSGTNCWGIINQLDIVDIKNIYSPKLVKSYPLTNPHGLDKDGNLMYVCDGKDGLKVLDATDVNNVKVIKTIPLKNAFDVICWNKVAIVSAADGIHQFDISNVNNIREISFIGLVQ
jgi:hypothetical protein